MLIPTYGFCSSVRKAWGEMYSFAGIDLFVPLPIMTAFLNWLKILTSCPVTEKSRDKWASISAGPGHSSDVIQALALPFHLSCPLEWPHY